MIESSIRHTHVCSALVALLLTSFSALALPVITGVRENTGAVAGGQYVLISGSGFAADAQVRFGRFTAESVRVIASDIVIAVTPAHLPTTVDVSVCQSDGCATLPGGFTFEGNPLSSFEMLLLPILTPPLGGAHGSEFRTELVGHNNSEESLVRLYGIEPQSTVIILRPAWNPYEEAYAIRPQQRLVPPVVPDGTPGRLVYVPKNEVGNLSLNLRAFDVSRSASNFGTELPIPRSRDFRQGAIVLPGIPLDPLFRTTLRIYSVGIPPLPVTVSFGNESHTVTFRPSTNLFEPAYAEFSAFPAGSGRLDVKIRPGTPLPNVVPPVFWAFVSVTNNDTQMITTITPQP